MGQREGSNPPHFRNGPRPADRMAPKTGSTTCGTLNPRRYLQHGSKPARNLFLSQETETGSVMEPVSMNFVVDLLWPIPTGGGDDGICFRRRSRPRIGIGRRYHRIERYRQQFAGLKRLWKVEMIA